MKDIIRFGFYSLLPFGLVIVIVFVSLNTSVSATQKVPNEIVLFEQSEELESVYFDEDIVVYINDFYNIKNGKGIINYCEIDPFSNTMECFYNFEFLLIDRDILIKYLAKN